MGFKITLKSLMLLEESLKHVCVCGGGGVVDVEINSQILQCKKWGEN
jgi:hypothetical protein